MPPANRVAQRKLLIWAPKSQSLRNGWALDYLIVPFGCHKEDLGWYT